MTSSIPQDKGTPGRQVQQFGPVGRCRVHADCECQREDCLVEKMPLGPVTYSWANSDGSEAYVRLVYDGCELRCH